MTLDEVLSAIAWTDNQFENMKKVVEAVAQLARQRGATENEIAEAAAASVNYRPSANE